MTYKEFIKKYNGKKVDYDGVSGVQCVDLIKLYLKEVFGLKPGSMGNAHCYFDNYKSLSLLNKNFDLIKNTTDFVPKKGDICIWKLCKAHPYGHVSIANGIGDTKNFESYDQNWGAEKQIKLVKHDYKNGFAGVLRPKEKHVNIKETSSLNIRKEPKLTSLVVGKLKKGNAIVPLGNSNNYTQIYNGYVATEYLK